MTISRRRSGRRGGTRRRTGRNVWVNEHIGVALPPNSFSFTELLTEAAEFMVFDTTVVHIVIPAFFIQATFLVSDGLVTTRYAIIKASKLADGDDFEQLFIDSIGPPWLGVFGGSITGDPGPHGLNIAGGGAPVLHFKAKRRFTENNDTLWLLMQSANSGGATGTTTVEAMVRTLIHIP